MKGSPASGTLETPPGPGGPALIRATCYTDPLCVWSWCMRDAWNAFRAEHADGLSWRLVLGGMIRSWDAYQDPLLAVSRPCQMGPHWFEAAHRTGQKVDATIWHEDPPSSSLPPCLAVKAAGRQDADGPYLDLLHELVMLRRRNIARTDVLLEAAECLADRQPAFDPTRFADDLASAEVLTDLQHDLAEVQARGIPRYPTLDLAASDGTRIRILGYRPLEVLRNAYNSLRSRTVNRPVTSGS